MNLTELDAVDSILAAFKPPIKQFDLVVEKRRVDVGALGWARQQIMMRRAGWEGLKTVRLAHVEIGEGCGCASVLEGL